MEATRTSTSLAVLVLPTARRGPWTRRSARSNRPRARHEASLTSQASIAKCYNLKNTQTLSFPKEAILPAKRKILGFASPRTFSTETELANRGPRYKSMLAFAEESLVLKNRRKGREIVRCKVLQRSVEGTLPLDRELNLEQRPLERSNHSAA